MRDVIHQNVIFLFSNEAPTTSRSWDTIPAVSGGFWRFLAILVSYVILWLLELTNYLKKWSFCLKWELNALNEVHTTSRSWDMNSAVFRGVGGFRRFKFKASSPAQSPLRVVSSVPLSWPKKGGPPLVHRGLEESILPQSSGYFDPEAHPEPPDRSEILIRRNFRKHRLLIRTKIISRTYIMKFLEMIQSLS